MKIKLQIYILGKVMAIEGILILLPVICGLIYGELRNSVIYALLAICYIAVGLLISLKRPKKMTIYLKDGCIATALSWIVLSICGCLPFIVTGEIPSFTNAMFETVSGFTTTGASILTNVEGLSHISLMWRSLTHWIGGMGVLVFLLAVVPMSGGSNLNLMKAESPGPSVGKFVPKVRTTAKALYMIYLLLTIMEIIVLFIAGMPFFDSICSAFGTAGTGGFGIRNDSFASYAPHIQWIVAVFMIMFGVNFNFYYLLLAKQPGKALKLSEVKVYLGIILVSTIVITINVLKITGTSAEAARQSFFQVATVITTTGFATTDFDKWPTLSKLILVGLMFCGACAGSTGGGVKVSRLQIRVKMIAREIGSYINPRSVKRVQIDGKAIDPELERSVSVYFFVFLLIFTASTLIVGLEGHDLVTTFTSVAATINNIGPGLGLVGPTSNYAFLSGLSKWVLIFDMLAGRLELFPLVIFLNPLTYKGSFKGLFSKGRTDHSS